MPQIVDNGKHSSDKDTETNQKAMRQQAIKTLTMQRDRATALLSDVSIPLEAYGAWLSATQRILAQLLGDRHECLQQFRNACNLQSHPDPDDFQVGMWLNDQISVLDSIIHRLENSPDVESLLASTSSDESYGYRLQTDKVPDEGASSFHHVGLAQIFLSYSRNDRTQVEALYEKLLKAGYKPWMDLRDILPGEDWATAIERAIRSSDFFFACLSRNSRDKRGWIQREHNKALDIWQEKLPDDIYLIPVKLENCEIPERLQRFQGVNLFEKDGWAQLMESLKTGVHRRRF